MIYSNIDLQVADEFRRKIQCSLCFRLFSSTEELKFHYKITLIILIFEK